MSLWGRVEQNPLRPSAWDGRRQRPLVRAALQHALVLNVPLNHDPGSRFFEVMAAGVPQVVFGDPSLVDEHRALAERPEVFWASSLEELEELVLRLFAKPERLRGIPVAPPPYLGAEGFAEGSICTVKPLKKCILPPIELYNKYLA